ncbi:hypothetical protein [uncultured Spirosoma sp.]|uniref:hypothetical protein n=1 Tax=uncultured Spirosoma sp. TaxID=278208 RepID=UPI00258467B4|nr:hypothetical protein [uncultured Spirosoma sp.]
MDGYQLYKKYTMAGQLANWDSDAWHYGQLVHQAFYLVGITRLFDLLEQAEADGKRLELLYAAPGSGCPPVAYDVQVADTAPPTLITLPDAGSLNRTAPFRGLYPWVFV